MSLSRKLLDILLTLQPSAQGVGHALLREPFP